jgi:predicted anti-sigma-YlaC factor YlaD
MEIVRNTATSECDPLNIFRYLDGDLSSDETSAFESHLAACSDCLRELNESKSLALALDNAFISTVAPPIPEDFARRVSAAAVNDIASIRSPKERYVAIAICIILFLGAVAAVGGSLNASTADAVGAWEKSYFVLSFFASLLYTVFHSVTVFMRPVASSPLLSTILFVCLALLAVLAGATVINRIYRSPLKQSQGSIER